MIVFIKIKCLNIYSIKLSIKKTFDKLHLILNEIFQTCEEDKGYIIDYPNYYSYFDETNDYEIIIEPTDDNGEHVFEDE